MNSLQFGVLLITLGVFQLTLPTNTGTTIIATIWFVFAIRYVFGILRE